MNRPNTLILSAGLVLSPVLLTAAEWVRLTVDNAYVEIESDSVADAASHLQAVADRLAWWHAAAYLDLAYIGAWALALLAITVVVGRTRPVLAALSGLLGLISTLGLAMHWAFYYIPLASLAQEADRDLAARAASASGDDRLLAIALLMFLLGTFLAVLGAGVGLWRAHALPWWAALGLLIWLGYVVAGMEARPAALLNLALLLPFLAVARRLAPGKDPVAEREPTPA
ncbi:MAG: hypothetical protein ACRDP9_28105 [Kribbellaceae bacterium]